MSRERNIIFFCIICLSICSQTGVWNLYELWNVEINGKKLSAYLRIYQNYFITYDLWLINWNIRTKYAQTKIISMLQILCRISCGYAYYTATIIIIINDLLSRKCSTFRLKFMKHVAVTLTRFTTRQTLMNETRILNVVFSL